MGIFDWFSKRRSRQKEAPVRDLRKTGAHALPKQYKPGKVDSDDQACPDQVAGRIVDGGPGKNVLARNKFLREDTGTHETLKIIDDSILDDDEETGFDPYNTGSFDRSKSWSSSRSRN